MVSSLKKMIFIDGHSLIHRAFYALPPLTTRAGQHTNAVYGFAMMLGRLIEDEKPEYLAVAFDLGKATFRHEMYASYKKDRPQMEDELRSQIPLVKQLVQAYNIPSFELEGYEADDIIGTLSKQAEERGFDVLIVTGDMDMLQLVSDRVSALITRRGIQDMEHFGVDDVVKKLGVRPTQVADWKGLAGDPSDNIPGVPRIGPKTATRLLDQYGSVENLVNHAQEVKGKVGESLRLHQDQALLSKQLARISRDVPIDVTWDELRWKGPNKQRLMELYSSLEFRRLLDAIDSVSVEESASVSSPVDVLDDPHEIQKRWQTDIANETSVALLPIYEGSLPHDAYLIGMVWAGSHRACYIPVGHQVGSNVARDQLRNVLHLIFAQTKDIGASAKKVTYDVKTLHHLLASFDIAWDPSIDDVMLQAYVWDPGQSAELEHVADRFGLKIATWSKNARQPKKDSPVSISPQEMAKIAGARCRSVLTLHAMLTEKLTGEQMTDIYTSLELALVPVLGAMERRGIRIDPAQLRVLSQEMTTRVADLEEEVFTLAGERFNLNSPRQTAQILFEKLQLPVIAKTKSGPSTGAEVLQQLADEHDIAKVILQYRQVQKLKSTYVDALPTLVNKNTGRLHTTFNQAVTATGRLSSTTPNLQNIPIRSPEGRRIRKVFVAEEGYTLVQADYSQIELRVLAHIANDEELLRAFMEGADIHRKTASEIFEVDFDDVNDGQREAAKAVNFGIVYGISSFGLSRDTGLTQAEAQQFIDRYFERYQGVARYMEETVEQARRTGYVSTLKGRRRYLPDIRSRNWHTRKLAERTAINTPIQGSAADIIKEAMIGVARRIRDKGFDAHLLLQVHDELLIEVRTKEVEEVAHLVKEAMEKAGSLKIPLVADVRAGNNWLEQHAVLS